MVTLKIKYLFDILFKLVFSGDTDTYSEIFKYDIHNGKFLSHQKIHTHAASDIKYFCFQQNHDLEIFLVVANSYELGCILSLIYHIFFKIFMFTFLDINGEMTDETKSVIYKFADDFFIPFQSLTLKHAIEWLPVVVRSLHFF